MFGEKPIVGQTIIRIKSDRIILPEFTHVEAGDLVSATLDPYQKKVILLQEKELIERLNTLHEKMQLARSEGRLGYKDYYELQRYYPFIKATRRSSSFTYDFGRKGCSA